MTTHGRIDVLVNDIWGAEVLKGGPAEWNTPIWKLDLKKGLRILRLGIETHLVTSHYLLPLLVAQPGGLLVEVTDGTADYNAQHYRISVFYDLVKQSVNRLAFSQGHELGPHGATAVAITPGWLRSEMMLENFGVTRNELARGADGAGRRPATRRRPISRCRNRRAMSAAPWPRSPPIPIAADGIRSRSAPANSRVTMALRMSTARGPTSGATRPRFGRAARWRTSSEYR